MKIVTLVSAVNQNIDELVRTMNLQTDGVITNQCDRDDEGAFQFEGNTIRYTCLSSRGVGVNRNTCIKNAGDHDLLLFSDEDIVYDPGYAEAVEKEYLAHPEADGILFNMRVCENRRTYWNSDCHRIRFYNYGRYPAYSISIKKEVLMKSGVVFPLEFGGGARYINGEDSVFLHDLLKKNVKLYSSEVCLGEETERESTWFKGFDDRFFISRGALFVRLYGKLARPMMIIFLMRKKEMIKDIGFKRARILMEQGIKEMREL